jgi:putative ABC transport system permease protein
METILKDLRYGLRVLVRKRAFTIVAVVTLAIGIGANSTMFSVVNAVILRSLPFQEPDRLVRVFATAKTYTPRVTSWKDLEDWQQQNTVFENLSSFTFGTDTLNGLNEPLQVASAYAGNHFFQTFHVNAIIGRPFSDDDFKPNASPVVILAERFWTSQFGSDLGVVGKTVSLNAIPTTIIGVVPDRFDTIVGETQVWLPYLPFEESRGVRHVAVLGRLKPGITLGQARAEMGVIASRLEQAYPNTNREIGATVVSLHDAISGDVRPTLLILFGAVGLVLLIACANVANLLMARATSRSQELAVRSAFGAGRGRLIRQLLTEGVLLSALGGAGAFALAKVATGMLVRLGPSDLPFLSEIRLDTTVVAFTALISLSATLIFGLIPALILTRSTMYEALKEGGRGTLGGTHNRRMRSLLVISELAVCLVLLIGCGLLLRSFYRLRSISPGFNNANLITAHVTLPDNQYQTIESQRIFYDRLMEGLGSSFGANFGSVTATLPLNGGGDNTWPATAPEGRVSRETAIGVQYRRVSPGYFKTMQIPVLRGREFQESDGRGTAPPVVILSQSSAKRLWPGENPIGKRIVFGKIRLKMQPHEVVGLVGDVKGGGLDASDDPAAYIPFSQDPLGLIIVVGRSTLSTRDFTGSIRSVVKSIDKELPVHKIRTMDEILQTTLGRRQFEMILASVFAGLALLLASVGTYGLISYSVTERTKEIGIRVALGADRRDLLFLVIGHTVRLTLIGIALGLAGAFAFSRALENFLFQISARDPLIFILTPLLLLLITVLASYIPARRAMKVEPTLALRSE